MEKVMKLSTTCCALLSAHLGDKTSFPSSAVYNSSLASYFANQAALLHPACIVSPQTAEDVSTAVRVLTSFSPATGHGKPEDCLFAIRSGGHASDGTASNIEGGVTIDLRGLATIDVDSAKSSVSVGVGNTWDTLYAKLESMGLGANGGRVSGIGVGGLSLGGGISYTGTRYGWTADTITNFQVVLADGRIVNANKKENPDLYWALKGGGNNFGIVTKIDLEAFHQDPVWGGFIVLPLNTSTATIREFVKMNSVDAYDPYSALLLTWGYTSAFGAAVAINVEYTKETVQTPPVFAALAELPRISGNITTVPISTRTNELGRQQPNGERQLWATHTFVSSEAALKATYTRYMQSLASIGSIQNLTWSYTLEPLPPALYARHADENALGLGNRKEALVVAILTASWLNRGDDARVEKALRGLMAAIEKDLTDLNALDPYVYLNYAAPWQDPIASYGKESVQRLKDVARQVDPRRVFARQVPGGFKLGR